jgi:hypothetical protein
LVPITIDNPVETSLSGLDPKQGSLGNNQDRNIPTKISDLKAKQISAEGAHIQ